MRKIYSRIIAYPKTVLTAFAVLFIISLICKPFVSVNYDMKDYLPSDTASTVALDVMQEEFDGGIPNARVMIYNISIPEALEYKEKLLSCEGVTDVTWLDDIIDVNEPISSADAGTVETYYKNNTALFTVTVNEGKRTEAVAAMRKVIGEENAMTGEAIATAIATESTVKEINLITVVTIIILLIILLLTTPSWFEPVIILIGLGVAVIINAGSNIIFGEISFVTNAAGNVLQLAVSLDYSVFLIHRFEECLSEIDDPKEAMVEALTKSTSSILSSGLTTVIGFVALIFMRFGIGPDLGLALAKGISISLVTVFVFMPVLILMLREYLDKFRHKALLPDFRKLGNFVYKYKAVFVCVFLLLIVPCYLASNSNSFYYGSSKIFDESTKLGSDTKAIENVFGKNDTYVLMIPNSDMATQRELSEALRKIDGVKSIISYVDTVGSEIPATYLDEETLSKLISDNYSRMVINVEADYEGEETFDLVEKIRDTAEEYYTDKYYLAGEGVSTYDLMDTIVDDTLKVNLIAIGAVFLILLIMMKSALLPIILVISIETAIWINLSVPYFTGMTVFYISYLIISSIQLGATVDYAILFTDRYMEFRQTLDKKQSVVLTISAVTSSVLTSGFVMASVGFLLGYISSHGILSQLGMFLAKGSLLSMCIVLSVLPGLLYVFDNIIAKTSLKNTKEKR